MNAFFEKHKRLIALLAPTLLGVIFIVLCAVNLTQSIWFDEAYGAYLTRFSYGEIWDLTYVDVHPPLYYFALKAWAGIFGNTDFAMRFMSVFFGAVAIVFAWAWLKRSFGVKTALFGTLMLAISPMLVRYGQEMRMYTMAAAIVFAATYLLQLAIDTRKLKYWIIYGVLLALGMWTHYFVALVWMAHLAYIIYIYRKKIFQKNVIMAYGVAVLLYLPWVPGFLHQVMDVQGGFWVGRPSVVSVTDAYTNSFVYLDSAEVNDWMLLLTLGVAGALVYLVMRAHKKMRLLSYFAFLPVVILLIMSVPPLKPLFLDRYLLYSLASVGMVAAVAICLVKFKTRVAPVILSLMFVGASVVGLCNLYRLGNYNKVTKGQSDLKAIFEAVVEMSEPGVPIIADGEWKYYDLSFYETEESPVYFIGERFSPIWGSQEPLVRTTQGRIDNLDAFLEEHPKIWWVGDYPCGRDKDGEMVECDKELEFPRDGYTAVNTIVLDVGVNQVPLEAVELTKLGE